MAPPRIQSYPRISDANSPEQGMLDVSKLAPLAHPIDPLVLERCIKRAIENSYIKSRKKSLDISDGITPAQIQKLYKESAKDLFVYFKRSDPASVFRTAIGRNCNELAENLFRKRETHNASMNAGWRYQFLLVECAIASKRFVGVSDVGTGDSDVNLTAELRDGTGTVNILVSMKNRIDTISGGNWEGSINKLEDLAKKDKNKTGAYCCVFALGMHSRAHRTMIRKFSSNTEIWPANFLWPMVSGYSYEDIMLKVSETLATTHVPDFDLPVELLDAFKNLCTANSLVDEEGVFNSGEHLIKWLCS